MANSSRNRSFRSDSKKIIYNVIQVSDQGAEKGKFIVPIAHPTKRASQIAGLSTRIIKKIRREAGDEHNLVFCSPKKKGKKKSLKKTGIDEFH